MVIGITGTNGAGKGTVVEYLVTQKQFHHFSARVFITKEVERRGLPIDRTHMRDVANELRKEHGPAYVAQQLMSRAFGQEGNSIVESIRTPGESAYIKSKGALLWAVDADTEIRYKRVQMRMSETDKVTFEQFKSFQEKELHGKEIWDMNVFKVMEMADAVFDNSGTLDGLYKQVDLALAKAGV